MTFNIEKSKDGQFYFTIKASNGETLAHSETYYTKQYAEHAINLIKNGAALATVIDNAK